VSAGPLVKRYALSQGFEVYDDEGLSDRTGSRYQERPGPRTVERALAWLAGLPKGAPAFLWVHLFEPHDPHPEGLSPAAGYAADHGEALGDEGEPTHGYLLGEAVLRVPLVLAGPGVPAGGRPEATAPAAALREYRRLERRVPAEPGRAPAGYGAGGRVGPLLD